MPTPSTISSAFRVWGGEGRASREVSDECQCAVPQEGAIHEGKENGPRGIANSGLTPMQPGHITHL